MRPVLEGMGESWRAKILRTFKMNGLTIDFTKRRGIALLKIFPVCSLGRCWKRKFFPICLFSRKSFTQCWRGFLCNFRFILIKHKTSIDTCKRKDLSTDWADIQRVDIILTNSLQKVPFSESIAVWLKLGMLFEHPPFNFHRDFHLLAWASRPEAIISPLTIVSCL